LHNQTVKIALAAGMNGYLSKPLKAVEHGRN
jgi:CheY-like chemotaxis protein